LTDMPDDLRAVLNSSFGNIVDEQSLSSVAGDGATRLWFEDGKSVIVKGSPSPRERNFYERHANLVRHLGVGVPYLYWSGTDCIGQNWIAIEDIPNPFPQERWDCDREQIKMLFWLHSGTWKDRRLTLEPEAYQPAWAQEMTRCASEWFAAGSQRDQVANQLMMLQREAQELFQPLCSISADPNPTNWRMRKKGELVLIDWERFSYGHPAIDLAITMPGLGSKDGAMEAQLADLYRECWKGGTGSVPTELDGLERLIRVAKLWSVVEFISDAKLEPERYPKQTVAYIVRELPRLIGEFFNTTN
jgi:hypothetical protein